MPQTFTRKQDFDGLTLQDAKKKTVDGEYVALRGFASSFEYQAIKVLADGDGFSAHCCNLLSDVKL